jgi:hypothetical protein
MVTASCQSCDKGEAEGLQLSFCNSSCRSVSYCSRACQKADRKDHKVICKKLNVGDAKQAVHVDHQSNAKRLEEHAKRVLSECAPGMRRFFDLFFELQGDTDHTDTVRKMKKLLLRESGFNRQVMLFRSLSISYSFHPRC